MFEEQDNNTEVTVIELDDVVQIVSEGIMGPPGPGLQLGGLTGQVLAKLSNADRDTAWVTLTQDSVADGVLFKQYSAADKTKLAGINAGATANSSDAFLLSRANHTGTQTASTISDFTSAADARITAQKATANGLATLDATTKIPIGQIPTIPASSLSNTAAGNISATTVQNALNELDTEKVAKAGDTMTGPLLLPNGSLANPSLSFSGFNNYGIHFNTGSGMIFVHGGSAVYGLRTGVISQASSTIFGWSAGASIGGLDTGMSRLAANSIAFGNGAASDGTATLTAGNITNPTTGTYTLGDTTHYYSNVFATRHTLNSTAYLDGATAGTINVTGMFNTGSDGFTVGTSDLSVRNSGNVGLGTTNPSKRLTILGKGAFNDLIQFRTSADVDKWHIGLTNGTDVDFVETGVLAARLYLKAGGNVGFGTNAPTHTLTIPSAGTGLAVYNTTDQTTNYERGRMYWTGNALTVGTESGGTGGSRTMLLVGGTTSQIRLQATNDGIEIRRDTTGLNLLRVTSSGMTASTGTQIGVKIDPTLNQTSTAGYTALQVNVTETATGSGAKRLLDLQVAGGSKFFVDNAGNATFTGEVSVLDDAYSAGWNGNLEVPTKNAVYDKVETVITGSNAYTDAAIANLVATAPATLDTLNELAIALGNDPNFATTMTTALSAKVTGPASATDNAIARFDTTTGKLIQNSSASIDDNGKLILTPSSNGEALSVINSGSGVSIRVTNSTSTTGIAAVFDSASTSTVGVLVRNQAAVRSGTGSGSLFVVQQNETTGSGDAMHVLQSGNGKGLQIDHNNTNVSLDIDHDVTNKNSPNESLRIVHTSVVNDGATYVKNGSAVSITSDVIETSGTITDSAPVVDINQNHADATGTVLNVDNSGTGSAIAISQNGTLAGSKNALRVSQNTDLGTQNAIEVTSSFAHTNSNGSLLRVNNTGATSTNKGIYVTQNGTGEGLYIDQNNTGVGILLDQDATSASTIIGMSLDLDNAGTGGAVGLNIPGVSTAGAGATAIGLRIQPTTAPAGATAIGMQIQAPTGGTNNWALNMSDTGGSAAGGITFGTDVQLYRSAANTLSLDDQLKITQANAASAIAITQNGNTGSSTSTGGALNIDNTANNNYGLIVYSNNGATQANPLVHFSSANSAYDQPVLVVNNAVAGSIDDAHAIMGILSGNVSSNYTGAVTANVSNATASAHAFYAGHSGASGSAFRTWISSGNSVNGLNILHDNASNVGSSIIATNAGGGFSAGGMVTLSHSNTGVTQYMRRTVTNKSDTSQGKLFDMRTSNVVTDGLTYTKTNPMVIIESNVTETSGTITNSSVVLQLTQNHATASGNVLSITNAGVGSALNIAQNGTAIAAQMFYRPTSTGYLYLGNPGNNVGIGFADNIFYRNIASPNDAIVHVYEDHASSNSSVLKVTNDGTGVSLALTSTAGTNNSGIVFGSDTKLYRSAASTLRTDGSFIVQIVQPNTNNTGQLGDASFYYNNMYATRHYFNSAAYLDGATSGRITMTQGQMWLTKSSTNISAANPILIQRAATTDGQSLTFGAGITVDFHVGRLANSDDLVFGIDGGSGFGERMRLNTGGALSTNSNITSGGNLYVTSATGTRIGRATNISDESLIVARTTGEGDPTLPGGTVVVFQNNNTSSFSGSNAHIAGSAGAFTQYFGDKDNSQQAYIRYSNATDNFSIAGNTIFNNSVGLGGATPTHNLTFATASSGIALYNTADQTTNFERGRIYWVGNTFTIDANSGGTGTTRPMNLTSGGGVTLTGGAVSFQVIDATIKSTLNFGSTGAGSTGTLWTGTFTGSSINQRVLHLNPTINQTLTASYTVLLVNPTETATGSGAKLLADFQVANVSKTRIDNTGTYTLSQGASMYLFNTTDEVTNYERGSLAWESNALVLKTAAGGTGASRILSLRAGVNTWSQLDMKRNARPFFNFFSNGSGEPGNFMQVGTTENSGSNNQVTLAIAPTIAQSSTASYTALLIDVTESSVGSGAKNIAEFKVGGVSKFLLTNAGIATFAGAVSVPDDAYDATSWDGSSQVPTKNAIRDKIESLVLGGGYSDEQAQDAVGSILVDSSEIDFTYSDPTPSITASLITGSVALSKLTTAVQTSLGKADTALQAAAIGVTVQAYDADLDAWAGKTAPVGVVVGTTDAQTLTNKTLTAPVISSISNTGTITLPTATDTLVGRATTDTLTNKTLTAPVFSGTITGTYTIGGTPTFPAAVVQLTTAQTLTNKTLTAPVISTITNTGTLTLPTSTDTLVGRATTDTLTNKTISGASNTITAIAQSSVTNLVTDLAAKATDSAVVHITGTEVITGAKTLTAGANFTLQDATDATKQARFDVSSITTGTVRTYTLPNRSASLAPYISVSSGSSEYFGLTAGNATTTSGSNLGIGPTALASITTGTNNVAIGSGALGANQTGGYNVAIGDGALATFNGGSGQANTAIGRFALNVLTTGGENLSLGAGSGIAMTSGSNNMLLGNNAGGNLTTGSNNIIIGKDANTLANNTSSTAVIGSDSAPIGTVYIGRNAASTTAQTVNIQNSNRTGTNVAPGDLRLSTGLGTGNATPAALRFATTSTTTAGTGQQSLTDRLIIDGSTVTSTLKVVAPSLQLNTTTPAVIGQVWTATDTSGNGSWQTVSGGGGGTGDVVGSASSTDNAVVRFDGTTGKLIQNSAVTIDDTSGAITGLKDKGGQVTNVKAYLAVGDGATDDTTAIQSAINALPASGGTLYFPPGTYWINTAALTGLPSGTKVLGAGRDATTLRVNSGTHNMWSIPASTSRVTFQSLTFSMHGSGGHIFAPAGSLQTTNWIDVRAVQNNPAKSILVMTDNGYFDNMWFGSILTHIGATSVPAFDFTAAASSRYNSNSWIRCQVNNDSAANTWFFDFASSSVTDYLYDNSFKDITGEINNGGFFRGKAVNGFKFDMVNFFDLTTTTKDLFWFGAGSGGVKSRNVTFSDVRRRGGTLGSGLNDIFLETSNANDFKFINVNTATMSGFTVDLNNNTNIVAVGSRGVTFADKAADFVSFEAAPTFSDYTNAGHNHTNAAGGGQLTDAALSTAVSVAKGGTGAVSLTSGNVLVGAGTSAVTATKAAPSGAFVGTTDSQTLTNKTLTSPAISSPTGLVKGDVGLGNVDNTSDATKNSATATLTNKRITQRVSSTASGATITPTGDASDIYQVTALATNAAIAAPSGTPTDGQRLLLMIKDNGTARTLTPDVIYRSIGAPFPTTTVISKQMYIGLIYNATDSKWDVMSVGIEPPASASYTITNVTADRTYDANSTTLDEVADVLGTLIQDLKNRGIVT